jgi:hypothetical protein
MWPLGRYAGGSVGRCAGGGGSPGGTFGSESLLQASVAVARKAAAAADGLANIEE